MLILFLFELEINNFLFEVIDIVEGNLLKYRIIIICMYIVYILIINIKKKNFCFNNKNDKNDVLIIVGIKMNKIFEIIR